jgi:hypothetical protein
MSTTPITITFRANEWEQIVELLDFAADVAIERGFDTTARQAVKHGLTIITRMEQSL